MSESLTDEIKMGEILIRFPRNDTNAVLKAKKILDIYLEDLLPPKRLITAKREARV